MSVRATYLKQDGASIRYLGTQEADVFFTSLFLKCLVCACSGASGGGLAIEVSVARTFIERCTFESNGAYDAGGGIYVSPDISNIQVIDTVFRQNHVNIRGSGIYFDHEGSDVNISGCLFESSDKHHVYFEGGCTDVSITASTFKSAGTGAISVNPTSSDFFIASCLFQDNSGGTALHFESSPHQNVIIQGNTFSSNTDPGSGGAVQIPGGNNVLISSNIFDSNEASLSGGAMYITSTTNLAISSNVFTGASTITGLSCDC